MNDDTLILVQGLGTQIGRVQRHMSLWTHHEAPLVFLSPTDDPLAVAGHQCVHLGREQHTGKLSLQRWRLYLDWMLHKGATHFLLNDSDSFCLSPEIPQYLYDSDVLWSNENIDNSHIQCPGPYEYFLAPWFMSRRIIIRILNASEKFADPVPPCGDHWLARMCEYANIPHKNFSPGGAGGSVMKADAVETRAVMWAVNHGACMVHGVQTSNVLEGIKTAWGLCREH